MTYFESYRRSVSRFLALSLLAGLASANDVQTSFEFPDASGQFSLGSAPRMATFTGGRTASVGLFSLYRTGLFSWMIAPGQAGEVTFGGLAESVSFFFIDENATVQSVVNVFGIDGTLLASANGSTLWTQVVAGSPSTPVGRITFTNPAGFGALAVDDFSACLRDPWSSYCVTSVNSTGAAATISASGSSSVTANDLLLSAAPLPNNPGLFYYGPNQLQLPFGDGFRCVGGSICRLSVSFGSGNTLSHSLDILTPPNVNCPISAGDTINFQAWFRDTAAMNSGFNLSDGIEITFVP